MRDYFFTLGKNGEGIFKDKGSKFIAEALHVKNEINVETSLVEVRKKHHSARHFCYAWVIGPDYDRFRSQDDGEPSHSAGDPILGQIKSRDLTNTLVIVTRYFGGTKLGVSGLINAYKTAAKLAIENAKIIKVPILRHFNLFFTYEQTSQVQQFVHETGVSIVSQEFDTSCQMMVACKRSSYQEVIKGLEDLRLRGFIKNFSRIGDN